MNSPTILAIDDNELNVDILVGILKMYDVIPALSGKDALQIVEEEQIGLIHNGLRLSSRDRTAGSDSGEILTTTLSSGVVRKSESFSTIDELLKAADSAMYEAKGSGRNRAIFRN